MAGRRSRRAEPRTAAGMKRVAWVGTAKRDLLSCPTKVAQGFGYALYIAQLGGKHESAKPLKGFGGAGVVEIISNYDGDTFRAI